MRPGIWFVLFAVMTLTVSCFYTGRDLAGRLDSAGDDYVVIGCIELDPPLSPDEQDVAWAIGGRDFENRIVFALGETPRDTARYREGYHDFTIVTPGRYFFLRQKRAPRFYLSAVHIVEGFTMPAPGQTQAGLMPVCLDLPGTFLIEPPEGEWLLYIGRIVYHRNERDPAKQIEIMDEFDEFAVETEGAGHRTTDLCRVRLKPGAGTNVVWK